MTTPDNTMTIWLAAASGALALLCALALAYKRRELWQIVRGQPIIVGALVTLAAIAVWLARVAGRRQPPPLQTPDRDLTPTPDARPTPAPPRPAEVDHARDVPLDTVPDPAAPLVADPDPDLGQLVLRLDRRAGERTDTAE
jgi:hypothetical protein